MKDFVEVSAVSGLCPLSNTSKLSRSSTRFQSLPANCTLPWVQGGPELEHAWTYQYQEKSNPCWMCYIVLPVPVAWGWWMFSVMFLSSLSGASRLCGPQEALRRCSRRDRTSGGRHPRALQPQFYRIFRSNSSDFSNIFLVKFDLQTASTHMFQCRKPIPAWRKFSCSPGPWLPVFGGPWLRQSLEITEHTDAEFAEDVVQSLLWLKKNRSFEGISYSHAHDCQARWSHWNT